MSRTSRYPSAEPAPKYETVIHGYHPEVADQYTQGYDHNDPELGSTPKRMDLDYIGPQRRSKRSASHPYGHSDY
jgi:hypothetical protein